MSEGIYLNYSFLYIQFHCQFLITNSRFWFVSILLRKFDASSRKEMKIIKTQILTWKTTKNAKKVHENLK